MGQLFDELKRRNVFRVAIAYAMAAWVLVQVTQAAVPALSMPDWVDTVVFFFLLIGFPVALLFAWAFEMTPEGVKKTKDVDRDASVTSETGRKINTMIGGALVLALGFIAWDKMAPGSDPTSSPDGAIVAEASIATTSIAVLPFVNMSSDPEQEYFSDGISEEILNVLAQIPDLHVTSRSSAFQFKGGNIDIPTVARQLGVAHILEGSVRKSGLRVRITAQLIQADGDRHLWSETYDRELKDVFAIQDEIAASIVAALKDALGLESVAAPRQIKAAANTDAYNAYLLGQLLIRKRTKGDIEASIPEFEKAIELDPDYAPAHAALGLAWHLLQAGPSTYGTLTLEEVLSKAMPHIERALELDPELADAHGVMGLTLEAQGQAEEAVIHFEEALLLNPSLTNVRNWYSSALSSLRREADAFREIETAYRLDPLSRLTGSNYASNLYQRRRFDDLEPVLVRMDQIDSARVAPTFRALALISRQQAAEGAITLLRGVDASPDNLRLKATAATSGLRDLGLGDEALRLWPFPDDGWEVIAGGTDYDRRLEMAQERYQDDPDNPAALEDLAGAYFDVGDQDQAEKMVARRLAKLGPAARPIAFINYIAVFGAWARGDEAAMLERLQPLEVAIDQALEAGIDVSGIHWEKAQNAFIQGQTDAAFEHATRALTMGTLRPRGIEFPYRQLGWNKIPRFQALRDQYETYLAAERLKLLTVACGENGFESWQPLAETCALLDQG